MLQTLVHKAANGAVEALFSTTNTRDARRASALLQGWLDRMTREGHFCETNVLIHPALAEELLKRNDGNRRLRPKHIENLARAIKAGRWINTGHPAIISRAAKLRDGQHRLHGIVAAGVPVNMDVRFGVDDSAFKVMDTGRKRLASDTLEIEGHVNTSTLASVAKMVHGLHAGWLGSIEDLAGRFAEFSNDLVLEFVAKHPLVIEAARVGINTGVQLKCAASPIGCAAFLIAEKHGLAKMEEFFDRVRAGAPYKSVREPGFRLRDMILKTEYEGRVELAAMAVKAWNAEQSGRVPRALRWARGEKFPAVE